MTLNINLEDVPDAILEAVKARIMASRRRLLDRQELLRQPPLQPKPQSRKFGADSKRWKRPQPAAVANYAPDKLVIWYPDEAPPKATIKGIKLTNFGYGIVPFQSVNAFRTSPGGSEFGAYFESSGFSFLPQTGPFTFEFWGSVGDSAGSIIDPFDVSLVDKSFLESGGEEGDGVGFISRVVIPSFGPVETELKLNFAFAAYQEGFSTFSVTDQALTPDAFNHIAFQRHNSTDYTLHINGVLIHSIHTETELSWPESMVVTGVVRPTGTGVFIPENAISQIRLSKSALYGTGTFTPPTKAFYKPAA